MKRREIIFDTETTGMSPEDGDRLVELGAIELLDLIPSGREFHVYVNPEREVPEGAVRVHGLTAQFLADKPVFASPQVVDRFLDFVGDSPLVAHNADFDRKFLNFELARIGRPIVPADRWIDTLALARQRYPGAPNSLDALCRRFEINLATREKHGALIDSFLLAEVYLQLKGGRERRLALDPFDSGDGVEAPVEYPRIPPRPRPTPGFATAEERAMHDAFIRTLGKGAPVWDRYRSEV